QLAGRADRLAYPKALLALWQQWRREQITSLVRSIHHDVKAVRPVVILSAAVIPWGTYKRSFQASCAYSAVAQDWYSWIRDGILDVVAPMTYQPNLAAYRGWVRGV